MASYTFLPSGIKEVSIYSLAQTQINSNIQQNVFMMTSSNLHIIFGGKWDVKEIAVNFETKLNALQTFQ